MCFFFVSRYMDEENQWGGEIKKQKLQKKKKTILSFINQLHPATTALPGCPHDQSLSQRCIIWHLNIAPVQGREECEEKKPHFPRQISIFLSPSTRQRSCTTAVSACNQRQRKNENSPVHKHMAAQNVAFCVFFSCFFFLELGKSQWARVTRNKEKTRRGLSCTRIKAVSWNGGPMSSMLGWTLPLFACHIYCALQSLLTLCEAIDRFRSIATKMYSNLIFW